MQPAFRFCKARPTAGPRILAGSDPARARHAPDAGVAGVDERIVRNTVFPSVFRKVAIGPQSERTHLDDIRAGIPSNAGDSLARLDRGAVQTADPGVVVLEKRALWFNFPDRTASIRIAFPQRLAVLARLFDQRQFRPDRDGRYTVPGFNFADERIGLGEEQAGVEIIDRQLRVDTKRDIKQHETAQAAEGNGKDDPFAVGAQCPVQGLRRGLDRGGWRGNDGKASLLRKCYRNEKSLTDRRGFFTHERSQTLCA